MNKIIESLLSFIVIFYYVIGHGQAEVHTADTLGVLCYTCTWNVGDQTCLTNPADVSNPTVSCSYPDPWCFIQRREYAVEPGKIHEFTRGCGSKNENFIDKNEHWITYKSSCNTPLCNTGDGLSINHASQFHTTNKSYIYTIGLFTFIYFTRTLSLK